MSSRAVVIVDITRENPPQMTLAEDNHVIHVTADVILTPFAEVKLTHLGEDAAFWLR